MIQDSSLPDQSEVFSAQVYPNVSNAFVRAGFISLKISLLWMLVLKVQTPQHGGVSVSDLSSKQ